MTSDMKMSPPTMAGGSADPTIAPKRSSWPTVLGIIGIIWASFALLCNFGSFSNLQYMPLSYVIFTFVVGLVMSVWLLWGSILLVRRSPSCRTMLIAWSIVEIIVVVMLFLFTVSMAGEMSQQLAAETFQGSASPGLSQDEQVEMMEFMLYATAGFTSLVSFVAPILFLSFLSTQRKRKEIAGWRVAG